MAVNAGSDRAEGQAGTIADRASEEERAGGGGVKTFARDEEFTESEFILLLLLLVVLAKTTTTTTKNVFDELESKLAITDVNGPPVAEQLAMIAENRFTVRIPN